MGLLSILLTAFFGLLSLFFYLRSRRRKRLTFTYDLAELQTRTHPEVTILFNGEQIENLSRLRVVVWNSGNQEIRQSDIPHNVAPSVKLNGGRILSVAVLDASAGTRFYTTAHSDTLLSIHFSFLNSKDFAIVDVLYESTGPKPTSVEFAGRVIGGLPSESRHFEQPLEPMNWIAPIGFTAMWCVGAYYFALNVHRWIHPVPNDGYEIAWSGTGYALLLFVGLIICCVVIYEYLRRYRKSYLPQLARHAFDRVPTAPTPTSQP